MTCTILTDFSFALAVRKILTPVLLGLSGMSLSLSNYPYIVFAPTLTATLCRRSLLALLDLRHDAILL